MVIAFARGFAQLGDPAFRRPLLLGLGGALLVFAALWVGLGLVLAKTQWLAIGWLEPILDAAGGLAVVALTIILYPAVAAAIMSLFLDRVASAVESRHYPDLPPARSASVAEQIAVALRLLLFGVVLNLAVLPLYLIPGINLVIFYGLNGYILGREYFEMVALRRLDPAAMRRQRSARRLTWFAMGALIALLSTLPVINLVAPLVAVAAMTHIMNHR